MNGPNWYPPTPAKISIPKRPDKKPLEMRVLHDIRSALSRERDVHIMRNNVTALKDANGRLVRSGLGEGSPDLVGMVTMTAWLNSVASAEKIARWFAIEVKRPEWKPVASDARWKNQNAWIVAMRERGVVCGVAKSVDEAMQIVNVARGYGGTIWP